MNAQVVTVFLLDCNFSPASQNAQETPIDLAACVAALGRHLEEPPAERTGVCVAEARQQVPTEALQDVAGVGGHPAIQLQGAGSEAGAFGVLAVLEVSRGSRIYE